MFIDASLAARIDRVEARLARAVASAIAARDATARTTIISIGDGVAVFGRAGSPVNKLIGAGFTGVLDDATLDEIERAWRDREEPVRVELATLASTEAAAQLSTRGYKLVGFENVLVRSLATTPPRAEHVAIDVDGDRAAWMRILVDGFAAMDGTGVTVDDYARDAIEQVMRDFSGADGFSRYVASLDGKQVGAATMRMDDGIALMSGATTLPASRRRGVQAALLAARLADAHASGCELAVVTTAPGSQSQANVMRSGFALGYARAILVR
jgi:GNAT superfamily N-acetyltransferase